MLFGKELIECLVDPTLLYSECFSTFHSYAFLVQSAAKGDAVHPIQGTEEDRKTLSYEECRRVGTSWLRQNRYR